MHVDMDSFYASVEVSGNPVLRGKPVIVGADPRGGKGRGVVLSCTYEARSFGVCSAMPVYRAYALCPQAVYLKPQFMLYERVSRKVMRILRGFADRFEQLSIDEAFLDVSSEAEQYGSAEPVAKEVKLAVWKHAGLTCSVGVAPSRVVAKIASEQCKPNGLLIVEPCEVDGFLAPLPVSKVPGVGKRVGAEMGKMGISTIGDLSSYPADLLRERFGTHGVYLWRVTNGLDSSITHSDGGRRSIGSEGTFGEDVGDYSVVLDALREHVDDVYERVQMGKYLFRNVGARIRFEDFETVASSRTLPMYTDSKEALLKAGEQLVSRLFVQGRRVRLVGVRVTDLIRLSSRQQSLAFWSGFNSYITGLTS